MGSLQKESLHHARYLPRDHREDSQQDVSIRRSFRLAWKLRKLSEFRSLSPKRQSEVQADWANWSAKSVKSVVAWQSLFLEVGQSMNDQMDPRDFLSYTSGNSYSESAYNGSGYFCWSYAMNYIIV